MPEPASILPRDMILPQRTVCGRGTAEGIVKLSCEWGERGLLVHGASLKKAGVIDRIAAGIPPGVEVRTWQYSGGEPTLDQLADLLAFARRSPPDWIAGVGGGSVMDVAKACAGLLDASGALEDYHNGASLPPAAVPFAAAPTTAGTGSEATVVSVLTNKLTGEKKSIRHPTHMPRLVVLDPDLLAFCPASVIAASGMDALVQAAESFVSTGATEVTDSWALESVGLLTRSLEGFMRDPAGPDAEKALIGSYLAGLALSSARLGLVHGLAHPLGTRYSAAHGVVCAVCFPHVMEFNRNAVGDKYEKLCHAAGGDIVDEALRLQKVLHVRSPFSGEELRDEEGIIRETMASGSTKANPRPVSAADVEAVLRKIFGV